MDWIPIVFIAFKVLVFGTCMFFAIKWHYDQGKKRENERRVVLRASVQVVVVFVISLLALAALTWDLAKTLGLDLTWP